MSLGIATQRSLQESILEMPKIPKKKSKAGGGGSANLILGDDHSVGGGVGRSVTSLGKGQQLGEEPKVSNFLQM